MGRDADRSAQQSEVAEAAADPASFWSSHWRETLLLVVLPLLLYVATVNFGFVLDDKIVIEENGFVQQGIHGIGSILSTEILAGYIGEQPYLVAGSRYRPLSMLSFALENQAFGLKPAVSHLINVLLYALTILVLFRFFSVYVPGNAQYPWYFRLPFVAALLFALHPLHSEVVANIKGRDEILALLFALATSLLTYRYVQSKRRLLLALSGLTFLLALLGKENAITFMAAIPLTVFVFTRARTRTLAIAMLPLAISTLIFLLMRYRAIGFLLLGDVERLDQLMNNPFVEASTAEKYGTIFYTWGLYLKLLIFPHPLTHDYYPYQIPLIHFADPRAIAPLILYLAMSAFALLNLRRGNVAAWSILFFLATFSIVSNLFFPIGAFMSERFMYTPSVGFCLFLAWILTRKLPAWLDARPNLARRVPLAIVAAFALGFGFKTFARVPDWKDDISLNRAGAQVSTGSARANCFMGYSLYEAAFEESNDARKRELLDEAASYLDRSLAIFPSYAEALNVYAGVLSSRYMLDGDIDALLGGFFEILTRNKPLQFDEFLNWLNAQGKHQEELANFYVRVGYEYYFQQQKDEAEAKRYLDFGHLVAPDNPLLLEALGNFWLERQDAGGELQLRRDAYMALKYAQEGIALGLMNGKFHEIAAAAYEKLGDPANADRMRQRASDPNSR
jgi:hypothetical protein